MDKESKGNNEDNGDSGYKVCPIMTSGNVSKHSGPGGMPNQVKKECIKKMCGIWNEHTDQCGLISLSRAQLYL